MTETHKESKMTKGIMEKYRYGRGLETYINYGAGGDPDARVAHGVYFIFLFIYINIHFFSAQSTKYGVQFYMLI